MSNKIHKLPDWWQRETQRRQMHLLVLLTLLLFLIAFFYYVNHAGVVGIVAGIDFDTSNSIAFVRREANGQTSLYSVRADSTNLRRLTPADDKSDKSSPAWNDKGNQIYYASNRDDPKKTQIYVLGTGEPRPVTHGSGRKENPQLMPDNKHLAYLALGAVMSINPNGNEVDQLLPPPRSEGNSGVETNGGDMEFNGPYLSYAFTTDGVGVAGVKELSVENLFGDKRLEGFVGGDQIAEVLAPNATKSVSLDAGNAISLAWEPGGSRLMIAYALSPRPMDAKGHMELFGGITLYTFKKPDRPTGKPLIISIGLGIMPQNITWSPDGKHIAFEAWLIKKDKTRELRGIVVMTIPETPLRFFPNDAAAFRTSIPTTAAGQPHAPRWAPDGSRLLYQVTRPDNQDDIWVVNTDLTNPINLTKGQADNTQGVWSPARPK